jgi:hypothetical protein
LFRPLDIPCDGLIEVEFGQRHVLDGLQVIAERQVGIAPRERPGGSIVVYAGRSGGRGQDLLEFFLNLEFRNERIRVKHLVFFVIPAIDRHFFQRPCGNLVRRGREGLGDRGVLRRAVLFDLRDHLIIDHDADLLKNLRPSPPGGRGPVRIRIIAGTGTAEPLVESCPGGEIRQMPGPHREVLSAQHRGREKQEEE